MIPLANYRGYTLCKDHPAAQASIAAIKSTDCWFEGDSQEAVKALIDEALDY